MDLDYNICYVSNYYTLLQKDKECHLLAFIKVFEHKKVTFIFYMIPENII